MSRFIGDARCRASAQSNERAFDAAGAKRCANAHREIEQCVVVGAELNRRRKAVSEVPKPNPTPGFAVGLYAEETTQNPHHVRVNDDGTVSPMQTQCRCSSVRPDAW